MINRIISFMLCCVPTYFFSNSPVRCLFTNVVFPTPPSPTNINLNSGTAPSA